MTDTQRAAFEAWCDREGINPARNEITDVYESPAARVAWRSWQAAQAADAGREPVAWLVTWPGDPSETWHNVFLNERDALDCASHHADSIVTPFNAAAAINTELVEALEGMLAVYGVREQHLIGGSMVSKAEVELCDKARAVLSRAKEQK